MAIVDRILPQLGDAPKCYRILWWPCAVIPGIQILPCISSTESWKGGKRGKKKQGKSLAERKHKIRWHKQLERCDMLLDWKNQYCEKDYTTQGTNSSGSNSTLQKNLQDYQKDDKIVLTFSPTIQPLNSVI